MNNDLINLTIGLFLPTVAGYGLLGILCRRINMGLIFSLALSYALGLGILAQLMLIISILEIPLTLSNIGIPLILITSLFLILRIFINKRFKNKEALFKSASPQLVKPPVYQQLLITLFLIYIIYSIIFVFWRAINIPIISWDAVATVAFKAKIFFYDKTIHHLLLPHGSYPLHTPFIQSWIAMNLGHWDEFLIKSIFPLYFISYLIIHYTFLKSLTNKLWTLGGLVLLVSSNFFLYHATISYRDFTLMFYNCTTIILLILWARHQKAGLLILAAIFSGMTTFVKLEGTGYLFVHTLLFLTILFLKIKISFKDKINTFLLYTLPSCSICFFYHIYKISIGGTNFSGRTQLELTYNLGDRFFIIIKQFCNNLFLSGNWNVIWLLLVLSLLIHSRKLQEMKEESLLLITLTSYFILYFFIALLTESYHWLVGIGGPTTLTRVFLHFYPLASLIIILLNSPAKSETNG